MIVLNGKKFAENHEEFTGGTCVGYAKRNKRSVTLMNPRKEKIAVINRHGVLCAATKTKDGKWWYSLATVPEVGRWPTYADERNECLAALDTVKGAESMALLDKRFAGMNAKQVFDILEQEEEL